MKNIGVLLVLWALFPGSALALGMGDINLKSSLNERFLATIPLVGVSVDEMVDVTVRLANSTQFQKAGIEKNSDVRRLRFEVVKAAADQVSIKVTSKHAIREPSLSFVLDVSNPNSRTIREFTVLMELASR